MLAFVLGLLFCDLVSAQVYQLDRPFNPNLIKRIQAQPQSQPAINPGLVNRALNSPGFDTRGANRLRDINLGGPVSQDRLNLPPGFEMKPIDPPQTLLPRPLPPQLRPLPQPSPQPAPQPSPQPQGPTLQFGPGGPSISFGSGPNINIPIGQIGQRIRERRGFHSPTQVTGYGPNGEIHTGNATVHGSTFTPGRNLSQQNGTRQQVQQPIYDQNGNVVGYQAGTVWQNSITGQQHGNVTTYTPNGTGGMHQSTTMYSQAGGNITPMGK